MILEILLFECIVLSGIFSLLFYISLNIKGRKVLLLAICVQLLQAVTAGIEVAWLSKQHAHAIMVYAPVLSGVTNMLIIWRLKK